MNLLIVTVAIALQGVPQAAATAKQARAGGGQLDACARGAIERLAGAGNALRVGGQQRRQGIPGGHLVVLNFQAGTSGQRRAR